MSYENITILYNSCCQSCGGYVNESETNIFSDIEMEDFILGVFTGLYTMERLPIWYYEKTAQALFSGVESGFGATLVELEFGSVDFLFLQELQSNIYAFSAAKTYQQVRILNGLMFKYRDRPDLFFKEAKELFNTYNTPKGKNYLSAEYQTAKSQALMGRKWKKFIDEKDLFGCLVYRTVGDSRVRDSHRKLQGFKAPVNDPIWKTISPANDWRCRCDLDQVECGFDNFSNISNDQMIDVVPIEFRFNVWFDKIVFSPKHPYFKVARGDKELAFNNFNLPLP